MKQEVLLTFLLSVRGDGGWERKGVGDEQMLPGVVGGMSAKYETNLACHPSYNKLPVP